MNFSGYATVLLPGYLIYKYVRISKYLQRKGMIGIIKLFINFVKILLRNSVIYIGKGCLPRLIHSCFVGSSDQGLLDSSHYSPTPTNSHVQRTFFQDSFVLIHCFLGLQVSYLTWGYLQEKIMTQVLKLCIYFLYFTYFSKLVFMYVQSYFIDIFHILMK